MALRPCYDAKKLRNFEGVAVPMVHIKITGRSGEERQVEASDGEVLMDILRDNDFNVLGTCGGMASCGTCHIYVDSAWMDKLGEQPEDEQYMLEALAEVVEVRDCSRLSCQITVTDAMDGLTIEVAPEA